MRTLIWDVHYFCPLQCLYCYSNSGPSKRQATSEELWRVARAIAREKPDALMISGGEPVLARGFDEIAAYLRDNRISLSLFTSGWGLDDKLMRRLAPAFDRIHVSLDSADAATNDRIRGKAGAHRHATHALGLLSGQTSLTPSLRFGVDCTVVKSNLAGVGDLCASVAAFQHLNFINVSPAVPTGRANAQSLAELLGETQIEWLLGQTPAIRASLPASISLSVHRNDFLKRDDDRVIQLNANGDVRALKTCEKTVGNIVDESLHEIMKRATRWKDDSPLAKMLPTVPDFVAWSEVVRQINSDAREQASTEPLEVGDDADSR